MTSTALDECKSAIQTIEQNFQQVYREFTTVLATLRQYKDHVAKIQRKIELVSKRKSSVKKRKRLPKRSYVFVNDSTFKRANGKRSFYFNVQSNPYRHRTADFREINASGHKFLSCLDRPKTWNIIDVDALRSGIRDSIINEKRALLDTMLKDIDELSKSNSEDERFSSALSQAKRVMDFLTLATDAKLPELLLHEPNDRDFDWMWISKKYFGERRRPEECQRTWHLVAKPSINKMVWTPQEDVLLRRIVRKNGFQAWNKITEQLVPRRSEFLNFVRYQTKWKENHRARMKWTHDDNCKLLEMKLNTTSYPKFISKTRACFPNLSKSQIYSHLRYLDSMSNKRKQFFSKRERFMVNSYRKRGFSVSSIARILGSRTRLQIRDYCRESLNPIGGRWSRSETSDLLQAVKFIGLGRWTAVSEFVKERTPTQCRNKFRQLRSQHSLFEPSISERYSIKNEQRAIKWFFKKPKRRRVSKSISQRIELFFLKQLQKKVTSKGNDSSLAEHVFSLLDFLNFKLNIPAEYSQKINDWLISFPAADAPLSQDFDRFFEGTFVRFSSGLRLLNNNSIYTNISCKSDRVLPPSNCNINGFHTFSENYQQFVKKHDDINFESLWKQIDSVSEKKEFKVAKMLWYHMLKAMFFWPLKLSTVMPEDLLKT